MNKLSHKVLYQNSALIAASLPFTDDFDAYCPAGSFPIVEDPLQTRRTTIIGMFVLRSAHSPALSDIHLDVNGQPDNTYGDYDWSYNCNGLDGGWLISGRNALDGVRLALQYGISDAVIVGSNTVATEGITDGEKIGYMWVPYGPCSWNHIKELDPNLENKIEKQRKCWFDLGYVSNRIYPAQIVYTVSGQHFANSRDFLEARIFHDKHPNGQPIEVYIITGEVGANRIRERCMKYNLQDRIESILIILPQNNSNELDLLQLPSILYEKYDMKIVNHDGGLKALQDFHRAQILPQINLTLGRHQTVMHCVAFLPGIDESLRQKVLQTFDSRMLYFFSRVIDEDPHPGTHSYTHPRVSHGIPPSFKAVQILTDTLAEDIAIVTFDTRSTIPF